MLAWLGSTSTSCMPKLSLLPRPLISRLIPAGLTLAQVPAAWAAARLVSGRARSRGRRAAEQERTRPAMAYLGGRGFSGISAAPRGVGSIPGARSAGPVVQRPGRGSASAAGRGCLDRAPEAGIPIAGDDDAGGAVMGD